MSITPEELIAKMSAAYATAYGETMMHFGERHTTSMAAAFRVCVEAVLSGPNDADLKTAADAVSKRGIGSVAQIAAFEAIISWTASRRSHYLKPKSDPAVAAVQKFLNPPDAPCTWGLDFAEKLIAVIDEARRQGQ